MWEWGPPWLKINIYPKLHMYMYLAKSNLFTEPFYSHGQLKLHKLFIGTNENFYIRKRINS